MATSARILLVEDDGSIGYALKVLLGRRGHDVTLVPDVDSARAALAQSTFDAGLIDRRIPGDGLRLAEQLEDGPLRGRVWVVTGDPPTDAVAFPRDRIIRKPFDFDGLIATVEHAVREGKPPAADGTAAG